MSAFPPKGRPEDDYCSPGEMTSEGRETIRGRPFRLSPIDRLQAKTTAWISSSAIFVISTHASKRRLHALVGRLLGVVLGKAQHGLE